MNNNHLMTHKQTPFKLFMHCALQSLVTIHCNSGFKLTCTMMVKRLAAKKSDERKT